MTTLGHMIEAELERARREPRPEVKPLPEIDNEAAIRAMTRELLPQLRADQKVIQRATAVNELLRKQLAAAKERALVAAASDVDDF